MIDEAYGTWWPKAFPHQNVDIPSTIPTLTANVGSSYRHQRNVGMALSRSSSRILSNAFYFERGSVEYFRLKRKAKLGRLIIRTCG